MEVSSNSSELVCLLPTKAFLAWKEQVEIRQSVTLASNPGEIEALIEIGHFTFTDNCNAMSPNRDVSLSVSSDANFKSNKFHHFI